MMETMFARKNGSETCTKVFLKYTGSNDGFDLGWGRGHNIANLKLPHDFSLEGNFLNYLFVTTIVIGWLIKRKNI